MLKNKVFIFIIAVFCIFGFLCGSAYATEEAGTSETVEKYSFTGFDSVSYELPALPEGVSNYTHYVLVKTSTEQFAIFCFNETLDVSKASGLVLNGDSGTTGKVFIANGTSWFEYAEQGTYSFADGSTFIYSCPDLTQYSDELNSSEDFFLNPQTVLPPVVEKIRLGTVLQEIVEVLPVVLMVIVVLIAMRKALAFLTQILRQS